MCRFVRAERRPPTIRELSEKTGMVKSHVHGVLQELVARGYVDVSGREYIPSGTTVSVSEVRNIAATERANDDYYRYSE